GIVVVEQPFLSMNSSRAAIPFAGVMVVSFVPCELKYARGRLLGQLDGRLPDIGAIARNTPAWSLQPMVIVMIAPALNPVTKMRVSSRQSSALKRATIAFTYGRSF